MNASPWKPLIAIALALYAGFQALGFFGIVGVGAGSYATAAFAALAVSAAVAAVGVWLGTRWAPVALVALGAVFAVCRLYEGFVLGIRPWLFALVAAVVAVLAAMLVAAWVRRASA